MHRNTVGNVMNIYEALAPPEFRAKIISGAHFSLEEIEACTFLLPRSRRPKSHSRQVSGSEEIKIIADFWKIKVGAKKLVMILTRKKEIGNLTLAQVRWIYKRNGFRVQKVRTKNGETRSLYNYRDISAFEDMHYDTKELADAKSLPLEIYENLKHTIHLPIYEWNIIDVASRSRFIAYSRWKSSTFWIQFLIFVTSHLRYHWITKHIRYHTDWGSEFFSGSERKMVEWNELLIELDAEIDCYNPNWDIRKNLIERSHRSDDEEFLIPFGASMKTKVQFMAQAQEYSDHWNMLRGHSGKGMDGKTPKEKLLSLWMHQAERILSFKVLYLDESFYLLQKHLEYFQFQRLLWSIPKELFVSERKIFIDLITRYSHMQEYAQNVLTYYQSSVTQIFS
jgi:putative transposase